MLLAIDIGNSHIVCGIFDQGQLIANWRLASNHTQTSDEYGTILHSLLFFKNLSPDNVTGCIISSVVPPLTTVFESLVQSFFNCTPFIVTSKSPHGLKLQYDNPEEIGSDRIVNAVAAINQYQQSLIIVDFGTATTFCTISQAGVYLGGVIAPGLKSAADSLHLKTAKLPKVDLITPSSVIGKNTVTSMQSGLMFGYAGLVDAIVTGIQQEISEPAFVIATGGLSQAIVKISKTIQEVRPNLTLEGLAILHSRHLQSCG
ncbi:MAG: type III pantothenate kinase [Nitrospira sp.]|nr:type III pantothenate kinase [Nitrospira sp.]MCA9466585.1 type III pantothenate kinase [Nitrospira sp.]MCA9479854.1 type III pantothenate kinase [Nitrospira sp.]MCB9711208.1 type III pantothenate kinase [Nitrospiraceae bacterium]MDR4486785.1 type III pantothenate kinase [Nitrospirales bacterium]